MKKSFYATLALLAITFLTMLNAKAEPFTGTNITNHTLQVVADVDSYYEVEAPAFLNTAGALELTQRNNDIISTTNSEGRNIDTQGTYYGLTTIGVRGVLSAEKKIKVNLECADLVETSDATITAPVDIQWYKETDLCLTDDLICIWRRTDSGTITLKSSNFEPGTNMNNSYYFTRLPAAGALKTAAAILRSNINQTGLYSSTLVVHFRLDRAELAENNDPELVVDNISVFSDTTTMKMANLSDGASVRTKGFYSENDGGAAQYNVTATPFETEISNAAIQLDNGLYANLVYSDLINAKQIGAKGNGIDNDFAYINSIASSGNNIYLPAGIYNMDHNDLHCSSFVTITGADTDAAVLKDTTIYAPAGIKASNLTFDGGNTHTIQMAGRAKFVGDFLVVTTPSGATSVQYTNCSFKNADYGSFAMENKNNSENYFTSDKATGCIFINLKRIGVYHCVDSLKTRYNGNTFIDMGDSEMLEGTLAALKIGDTTNNTTIGSQDCIISDNTFRNLYSGDDLTNTKHSIACNFITVFGEKANITSNKFYNLFGYGEDRESIYTKVRQCTITDNYISNGGFGEGYICNKGYPSTDTYATITNNEIEGDYGTGIKVYGDGLVKGNTINIAHCQRGISCNGHSEEVPDSITIDSNILTSAADSLYYDGTVVSTYTPTYFIQIEEYQSPAIITNNTINASSINGITMQALVRIGSVSNDFTIENNILNSTIPSCSGIQISARDTYQNYNKNGTYKILSNKISTATQPIGVTIQGNVTDTNRHFEIINNELSCSKQLEYCATVSSSTNNQDTLIYNNINKDISYSKNELATNVKSVQR